MLNPHITYCMAAERRKEMLAQAAKDAQASAARRARRDSRPRPVPGLLTSASRLLTFARVSLRLRRA